MNGPSSITVNEKHITSPVYTAKAFNHSFTNIASEYTPDTDVNDKAMSIKLANHISKKLSAQTMFNIPNINEKFVLKQLQGLNTKKATGTDNIPPGILRLSAHIIAPSISKILNLNINTGIFTDLWKMAKVSPLYKSGENTLCSNYRPISVL